MKHLILLSSTLLLSGCFATAQDFTEPQTPQQWTAYQSELVQKTEIQNLSAWWKSFNDPVLNVLVDTALSSSPDRLIAEARITEARGLKRTARSSLFLQIGASANGGREDTTQTSTDNFYDAKFDASFEVDVFGKNRKASNAATAEVEALRASYHDVSLTLIADVTRAYIQYRAFEKQVVIAQKNLTSQEKTLDLIREQQRLGEAPQLDVERAENLVNTTKSSIPEFKRLSDNARLQLTVLTGQLPEQIMSVLSESSGVPAANAAPVLLAPAQVLALRPDIRAAAAQLNASTLRAESVTAEFFPSFTVSGFFGVADNALASSMTIWDVALGAAVSLIDFGRIEGRIDAARARETQAYQAYRKTVLNAVVNVETALTDYARVNERRVSLQSAYGNAERALTLSQNLFSEGEISFLDVLDAQRTLNAADSELVNAEALQAESLVRLYKSLGVYD